MPTAHNSAQPAGFNVFTIVFMYSFVLNLFNAFETIVTIMKEGSIIAIVAVIAPNIPNVAKPVKVAIFTPIGPGVIDDIASISVN